MIGLLGSVLPLAIVDAVSIGALALPVWFLLSDRARHLYICTYLLVLAGAYAAIGLLVLNGPAGIRTVMQGQLDSELGNWVRGVTGLVLIGCAVWYGLVHKVSVREPGAGRLTGWRDAVAGDGATIRAVVGVALIATAVEIPTALPYAVALGRVDETDPGFLTQVSVVLVYAAVMIVPALVLTVASALARRHVTGMLHRVDRWFRENAQENTAWLMGLIGVALLFDTPLYDAIMDVTSGGSGSDAQPIQ